MQGDKLVTKGLSPERDLLADAGVPLKVLDLPLIVATTYYGSCV